MPDATTSVTTSTTVQTAPRGEDAAAGGSGERVPLSPAPSAEAGVVLVGRSCCLQHGQELPHNPAASSKQKLGSGPPTRLRHVNVPVGRVVVTLEVARSDVGAPAVELVEVPVEHSGRSQPSTSEGWTRFEHCALPACGHRSNEQVLAQKTSRLRVLAPQVLEHAPQGPA